MDAIPDRKPDIHVYSPREMEIWYEEGLIRIDGNTTRHDLRPSIEPHSLRHTLLIREYVHYVASIPSYPNHQIYKRFLDEIIEKEIFHST